MLSVQAKQLHLSNIDSVLVQFFPEVFTLSGQLMVKGFNALPTFREVPMPMAGHFSACLWDGAV